MNINQLQSRWVKTLRYDSAVIVAQNLLDWPKLMIQFGKPEDAKKIEDRLIGVGLEFSNERRKEIIKSVWLLNKVYKTLTDDGVKQLLAKFNIYRNPLLKTNGV